MAAAGTFRQPATMKSKAFSIVLAPALRDLNTAYAKYIGEIPGVTGVKSQMTFDATAK